MARAAQAGVGAAQVGAAEVEADHNSRVDDEGVYECDESFASCSGRGHVSRGGARSSAAGDPDERHDCDNDDATPPTIGYGNCHSNSDNDVGCSIPPLCRFAVFQYRPTRLSLGNRESEQIG